MFQITCLPLSCTRPFSVTSRAKFTACLKKSQSSCAEVLREKHNLSGILTGKCEEVD